MAGIEVKSCVCVRIHLDVIKPRDRKRIIIYLLTVTSQMGSVLCKESCSACSFKTDMVDLVQLFILVTIIQM